MSSRKNCLLLVCGLKGEALERYRGFIFGGELRRRGVPYSFGASDFWLWNILGTLIAVGPFIYIPKLATTVNRLAENYNVRG